MFVVGIALSVPTWAARESLGTFGGWGAFRDTMPVRRCFAIAEPVRRGGQRGRAFLGIGYWPDRGVRGQLQLRLSRRKARGTPVVLSAGTRRFALIAGGNAAWAPNARVDAAIVAAIRSATSLSVEGTGRDGRAFVDAYALRGAATAIDAAALGCARR
ncbi:hypothetical protein SAMN05192580_3038 [Sphingomonas jatrophae]|uniref:Uncharacterized protein n=2 Tax=Sphingomonas jatrophae TaxID=1166337 RepID=A0A1I6LNG0_9SPHN|nr:hypothetical protein SAMN05192580_3038 [Sphingomonas jatrophae]